MIFLKMNDIILRSYDLIPSHYSAIQIGANNGKCVNSKLISSLRIVFVEPVPRLFNELVSYHNTKYPNNNYVYINKAVTSQVGKIKIYYPSQTNDFNLLPWWIDQLCGTNSEHHGYEIDLDMSYIPTTTVNQICRDLKTICRHRRWRF